MGGPVEGVVGEVALEVAREAGEADMQVAGEGRPPALLEDQAVQGLDGAVGLRATGADERVPDAELGERRAEVGRDRSWVSWRLGYLADSIWVLAVL